MTDSLIINIILLILVGNLAVITFCSCVAAAVWIAAIIRIRLHNDHLGSLGD
jgi:hypothetical protein